MFMMLTLRVNGGGGGQSQIGYVDSSDPLRGLSIILHIILAMPFSVFIAWLPNPSQIRVCQKLDLAFASVHKEAIQKLTSLGLHVYKLYIAQNLRKYSVLPGYNHNQSSRIKGLQLHCRPYKGRGVTNCLHVQYVYPSIIQVRYL